MGAAVFQMSPYLGRRVRGRVHRTFLRGREVFSGGQVVDTPLGDRLLLGPPTPDTAGTAQTATDQQQTVDSGQARSSL